MKECWLQIPYSPEYSVSNLGNVARSIKLEAPGMYMSRNLKQHSKTPYNTVTLPINGKWRTKTIHRIVAETFIGKSNNHVNHIDGNKKNNTLSNLEYVTSKQNQQHASKLGLLCKGESNNLSKLNENIVKLMRKDHANGLSFKMIGEKYKISKSHAWQICTKRAWKHILTIILVLLPFNLYANQKLSDKKAILSIIGEAEGQSSDGMVAIGCALRARGNFKGVYGLHSIRVTHHLYSDKSYKEAVTAWKASSNPVVCRELIGNATGWGNSDDMYRFDRMSWFKKCHVTKQVSEHYFYACKEGK